MTDQLATEPVEGEDPAPEPEVASDEAEEIEAEASEQEEGDEPSDDDPTEDEPAEPETVEIELDGIKYSVPAALKDRYMQHADYTRKTQEVAAERKALEEQQTTLQQRAEQQRQFLKDYGELTHTDGLLEQFDKVDWNQLGQEDPDQAQRLALQFQVLQRRRQQIAEQITTRENEARVQAQRETAQRKDQLQATLARDIPNYSPQVRDDMVSLAVESGFSRDAVEGMTDPAGWKILHRALLGDQVLKRQKSAAKPKSTEPVKPVPKATGPGRSPGPTGPRDDMSMESWVAAERKRLAKKAGRA